MHPYKPLGKNVLLRAENMRQSGGLVIPDTVQIAPKHTFEVCALGELVTAAVTPGDEVFVLGSDVSPFPTKPTDPFIYFLADQEAMKAAVVKA